MVSTRPDASPDVDSETPDSAPIWADGCAQSDRQPGEQERREQIGEVAGVGRYPGEPEHADRQKRQPGDEQLPNPDDGDEPGAGRPPTPTKAVTDVASQATPVLVGE